MKSRREIYCVILLVSTQETKQYSWSKLEAIHYSKRCGRSQMMSVAFIAWLVLLIL